MTLHAPATPAWALDAVSYASPDARRLTLALHAEQLATYGHADDPTGTPAEELDSPAGLFLVVSATSGGPAVACGGWRTAARHVAEVKRMYVEPAHRGRGLGRLLLRELERDATACRHTVMILETGSLNHAALGLYAGCGYRPTDPYAPGRDPGINRAMRKDLPSRRVTHNTPVPARWSLDP
jgi:GNAT superfamily N-acetyltransferase